jgi:hypothetical protein
VEAKEPIKKIMLMNVKRNISIINIIGMDFVLFNSLYLLLFYEIAFVYLL